MTNKKKTILAITTLIAVTLVIFVFQSVVKFMTEDSIMTVEGCPYFMGEQLGRDAYFEECKGVISILKNNICDCFWVNDDMHNYHIVSAENEKNYKFVDMNLYLYHTIDKNDPDKYLTFKGDGKSFHPRDFFVTGELKKFMFESVEEIPQYYKINSESGEVETFVNIDDAPENDKEIFSKLGS